MENIPMLRDSSCPFISSIDELITVLPSRLIANPKIPPIMREILNKNLIENSPFSFVQITARFF